ncbi:MAG: hypothetical protein Q9167_002112 [Letrouitia subvulpina]
MILDFDTYSPTNFLTFSFRHWRSTFSMCFARLETNIQCGHNKVVITEECQFGATEEKDNCSGPILTIEHRNFITRPRLCVRCYRRKEHDICFTYKQAIDKLDSAIQRTRAKISVESVLQQAKNSSERDSTNLDRLKAYASKMEVERGDLADARYEALNDFRNEQGVWGDG